ncbi:hypothetical protein NGM10_11320 [Halorussus salilacus]|uniref:hypothetical protein n=1 Tax=Halorussus salilacus TaxID=2953750 RepID=UPI00209EC762|nr:hypothetical protein [Halorussus salilacus]USZ67319.1 hypothetical protein NGM10_11320 [Halorussus salilacus]
MDDDTGRSRERSERDRGASSGDREASSGDREASSGDRGDSSGDRGTDASVPRSPARDDKRDEGFGLSLPPVSLPEVRLPERIRLVFPVPDPPEKQRPTRVRTANVLLAAVTVDALDAATVALFGPETLPWARAVAGTVVSVLFVGLPGLLYAWELVAVLSGVGWLALAPTASALLVARAVVGR